MPDIITMMDKLIIVARLHELDKAREYMDTRYYWQRRNKLVEQYQKLTDHEN